MELTMNFGPMEAFGLEEGLKLCKQAGFDAIDYGLGCMVKEDNVFNTDGYREAAEELRKTIEAHGLHVNQTHTPFQLSSGRTMKHTRTSSTPAFFAL
jgi:hypothetical protein